MNTRMNLAGSERQREYPVMMVRRVGIGNSDENAVTQERHRR
jgi:hypothetical protein